MNFSDYENTHESIYTEFAGLVRSILKDAVTRTEGIPRLQSTKERGKSAASLKLKLTERDLLASERIENEIKDLAGIRLIFYTNTDVDRFLGSRLIPDTFDVEWDKTRIHYPTEENDQQPYQAIHYIVTLGEKYTALSEYKKFKGMRCEIQIQTVLNHAWAETYHDMVYKARDGQGFGTAAREALDKRMKKVMDDYLRLAGYEFQKAQHDHERLMQGKELFDRGAIETLEGCDNNNARHEILSTIAEHVIPNYDDIKGVYPEIRRAIETAVRAGRSTETKPIESPFGNFAGKTSEDVTAVAVGILDTLRYVDAEAAFRLLIDIYKGEQDGKIRKQITDIIKRLARYDLEIWKKAGPYFQGVLADVMVGLSRDNLHALLPIVLTVWRELLRSDMDSTLFSADKVTFNSRALPVYEDIKTIRKRAIDGLITLFDGLSSAEEKRKVLSALREATRYPARAECSNELRQLILEDTKKITDLLAQRAAGQPYELLEHIEHEMLFDYRRALQFARDEHDRFGCRELAKNLIESIMTFRDAINTDLQYIRYKTLVGFESVFPLHWEDDTFDYSAADKYRMEQAALFIDTISEETAEDWYGLIQRCAATKSDDMATFPVFGEFLRQLSKEKPNIVFEFVRRNDADLMVFLPAILTGLFESEAGDQYSALIENFLSQNAHLTAIARHCRSAKETVADTVKKVLDKAIVANEVIAVFECMIFAIEHHDPEKLPLVDNVFAPALKYLTSKQDARWVRGAYYLQAGRKFFNDLPVEYTDLVLENLMALDKIGHEAETILTLIAASHPLSVWAFLERRIKDKRDQEERYEAIPYQFYGLEKQLARDPDLAITTLRSWYHAGDDMFRFTGGRLLHAIFPVFTDELAISVNKIVAGGSEEDYDFITRLLENYCGEPPTHEVIKQLIDRLPENDSKLNRLDICLSNTGAVMGAFGMVDAYREKKEGMSLWLKDSRPKVKAFALSYISRMEQRIANEQRSAEARQELRKRDYESADE